MDRCTTACMSEIRLGRLQRRNVGTGPDWLYYCVLVVVRQRVAWHCSTKRVSLKLLQTFRCRSLCRCPTHGSAVATWQANASPTTLRTQPGHWWPKDPASIGTLCVRNLRDPSAQRSLRIRRQGTWGQSISTVRHLMFSASRISGRTPRAASIDSSIVASSTSPVAAASRFKRLRRG